MIRAIRGIVPHGVIQLRMQMMPVMRTPPSAPTVAQDGGTGHVIALVAGWPDRMRQVFTLRKVYGLHPRSVARRLGLSDAEVERYLIAAALACAAHGSFKEPLLPRSGSAAAQPLPNANPVP
jgi:hypothetical protein